MRDTLIAPMFSFTIAWLFKFFRYLLDCCRRSLCAPPGDDDFAEANRAFDKPDAPTNHKHLNEAITSYTKAIYAWGPTHENYPTAHVKRALSRLFLYELNGKPDAERLKKIIDDNHTALRSWEEMKTTSAALYFQACCSLGTAYRLLQPITRDLDDGRKAIKYHEKALAVAGDSRAAVLIELGTSRWAFSEMAKTNEQLNDAIDDLKEALGLCELDKPSHMLCIQSLASAYKIRYALAKDPEDSTDLESAITLYREAIDSGHLKEADKPSTYLNLSRALHSRNAQGDFDEAISQVEKAVDCLQGETQHPVYFEVQNQLGDFRWTRSSMSNDLRDFRLAIQAYKAALKSHPSALTLYHLTAASFALFQKLQAEGKPTEVDLVEIKRYAEEATELCAAEDTLGAQISELEEGIQEVLEGRNPKRANSWDSAQLLYSYGSVPAAQRHRHTL